MNFQNEFSVDSDGMEQQHQRQRSTDRIEALGRAYPLIPDCDLRDWNVSQLLQMLPIDKHTDYLEAEASKPPARDSSLFSTKEASKLHDEQFFKVTRVPKYEWRTASTTYSAGCPRENDDGDPTSRHHLLENDEYDHVVSREEYEDDNDFSLHRDNSVTLDVVTNANHDNVDQDDVPAFERSMIEICPGVDLPLRGSLETQHAIARNFTVRVDCIHCTVQVSCIRDAEYILCPMCYCVSPLELSLNASNNSIISNSNSNSNNNRNKALSEPTDEDNEYYCEGYQSFGVGLGFVDDER